ncbi:hypothetical protein GCM10010129_78550 [Streptomyces fumigatiscleroticus]|nr:hypothetical protein GCM10010129_78550 [Streptomyces fumigatiscleroticus]
MSWASPESAGLAATGLVVAFDDRGLGMPAGELAAANERITAPLDVTVLDSTRLGPVTVGRLAQRHRDERVVEPRTRSPGDAGVRATRRLYHQVRAYDRRRHRRDGAQDRASA